MAGLPDLLKMLTVKKQPKSATTMPPEYNPAAPQQMLALPQFQEHLQSLYDNRFAQDSKTLLQDLFRTDPDVSAAVASYLTLADTPMLALVRDVNGQVDPAATATLLQLLTALTRPTDYSQGFTLKNNMQMLCQELRYMLLLRGAIAEELVFDKNLVPNRLQLVDMNSIRWYETQPGVPKPGQLVPGVSQPVMLDFPSFFIAYHRRDPTKLYTNSDLISVINTVAARQQVVNDLYRIMQITGYPRVDLKVVEEVLLKNAPPAIRDNKDEMQAWVQTQLQSVADTFGGLRADQPFAHTDSVEAKIVNDKTPGAGIDISKVIEVLNAQNQAALKTMATVIGRGSGSTQVASAEVRIAAMNADQLNAPIKQLFEQAFTFLINSYGVQGFVEVKFMPAELRPDLELEPQRVLRQSRLLQDLSLGIITDEEYHLWMYFRLPPPGAPKLSGTNFQAAVAAVDASQTSPNANGGSLGNSIAPGGKKATDLGKSNAVHAAFNLLRDDHL